MSKLNRYNYDGGYENYRSEQIRGNYKKLDWKFRRPQHIDTIKTIVPEAKNILCHGTRGGGEQQTFIKHYPQAYVIGSEISDTATQFPNTVEHDFNIQRDEWIGKFDIIFSNAFDHSYDPDVTIEVWKEQLVPTGVMFLHWSSYQNKVSTSMDPVSGTVDQFVKFLQQHNLTVQHTQSKDLLECRL